MAAAYDLMTRSMLLQDVHIKGRSEDNNVDEGLDMGEFYIELGRIFMLFQHEWIHWGRG